MKKLNKIALAVISTAFAAQVSAGTVTLRQVEGNSVVGSEFRLGIVAKITGKVEVDLINSGFTTVEVDHGEKILQAFAFGQKTGTQSADPLLAVEEAELFSINPSVGDGIVDQTAALAALQSEVCSSSAPESISKLVAHNSPAGAGSCIVASGPARAVTAQFYADYAVRAAGGLQAILTVDTIENGIDSDYITMTGAADRMFKVATVEQMATLPALSGLDMAAGITVGNGGDIDNGSVGSLLYKLQFDIAGGLSNPESRVVFQHLLAVQ